MRSPLFVPLSLLAKSIEVRQAGSGPLFGGLALAVLAGCAQPPPQHATASNSKEYFSSAIYGPASARVVADGEAVPRGGGQYLVGRPYTIAGRTYYPSEKTAGYSAIGMASWYGDAFHGRRTANGEVYDKSSVSAAHPTMPLPSYARVTNLRNHYSIIVRVNDRGPYHGGRLMDVSQRVAEALDFRHLGTARVRVDYVSKAGLEGSDDELLLATLRTDGDFASLNGVPTLAPTLVANRQPAQAIPEPTLLAEAAPLRATATLPERGPLPPARPFVLGDMHRVPIAAPQSDLSALRSGPQISAAAARIRTRPGVVSGPASLD